SSLVTDDGLSSPADQHRPLMIVHGLADDNVVVAHALRLSSALLAAGRPHEVLPLSGVTHMTPQEQVAENLLLLQVDFLKRSLGLERPWVPGATARRRAGTTWRRPGPLLRHPHGRTRSSLVRPHIGTGSAELRPR